MTSPQCSLGWPGAPEAQGLTSSPPWPGPEPGFLLGLLLIPSKSLKACSPPSAPPWPVQPTLGSSLHRPSLHQCQAARQGFSQPGWPVPPPAQLKPAPDPSPVQEGSSLENLTKSSTSVKHPDTSLMASALLHLGGQGRLLGGRTGQPMAT